MREEGERFALLQAEHRKIIDPLMDRHQALEQGISEAGAATRELLQTCANQELISRCEAINKSREQHSRRLAATSARTSIDTDRGLGESPTSPDVLGDPRVLKSAADERKAGIDKARRIVAQIEPQVAQREAAVADLAVQFAALELAMLDP